MAGGLEVFNLGESTTTTLSDLIGLLESALDTVAIIDRRPLQPGDVTRTFADTSRARAVLGYNPGTDMEDGIRAFVQWLRQEQAAVGVRAIRIPQSRGT